MADIAKVKRNIQRMIDQNAPESDIDAYVLSEGTSPEELRGQSVQVQAPVDKQASLSPYDMQSEIMDMITMGGVNKLVAAGGGLVNATVDYAKGKPWDYSGNYNKQLERERGFQDKWRTENPIQNIVGKGVGLAVGGGTMPVIGRGLKGLAATSAAYGGTTGALQDADTIQDRIKNTASSAGTGLLLGTGVGIAAKGGGALLNAATGRIKVSPETQKAASILESEGVNLTAGQKTNSPRIKTFESELGGQKYQNVVEGQGEEFTRAALNKAGIKATRATPDVLDQAFTEVGQKFDNMAQSYDLLPDRQFVSDVVAAGNNYTSLVGQSAKAPIVANEIRNMVNAMQTGSMSGQLYKTTRTRLNQAKQSTNSGELRSALGDIIDSMDDAMERTIAKVNPSDLGRWGDIRKQYRNMLVIEKAATGAGADTAMGLLSPAQLRNAAIQKQGARAHVRGKGDFTELANAGVALLGKMANSGTAARTSARNMGASIPAILGGAVGSTGGPIGAIAGGLVGAAAPRLLGAGLMSKTGQKLLSGKKLSPTGKRLQKYIPAVGLLESSKERSSQ